MTYEVIIPFTVKTKQGDVNLSQGQTITLAEGKAIKFVTEGKIKPIDQFTESFNKFAGEISCQYQDGVIDYVRSRFPVTYEKALKSRIGLTNFGIVRT